ncbi:hypothetical protein SCHPADRAFT_699004 [Schizopora paradoxa]|uniref:F-box domain-containing protein n=1 Tax=Schizopora paradoxa TaxID=27342 RepID=A0A0H2R9J8_9AGAM|nr:hypothetical protein SCHPADRAFT_699004 [Schizopora paradoxa]
MNGNAVNTCFNVPDIILTIAHFIDGANRYTLPFLSRTNRCAYITLVGVRARNVSCHIVDTPSLAIFFEEQSRLAGKLVCKSLEIIGKECFYSDPREPESNKALVKILQRIGEYQTLETFSYHAWDEANTFLCLSKEICHALGSSCNSITAMKITAHPCNWDALFAIEFKVMQKFQLALSHRDAHSECGRSVAGTPLQRSNISNFLQIMRQLNHLVLVLTSFRVGELDVAKLHIPSLNSLEITGDNAPIGIVYFVARHTALQYLHLRIGHGHLPSPFQDHHLPELRALMMDIRNTGALGTFLARQHELANVACARRPRIEHLRILNVDKLYYLNERVQPFGRQLRRLDLHFLLRLPVFEGGFHQFLSSFRALVELSITLKRRPDIMTVEGPHAQTLTALNLRIMLRCLSSCSTLKAFHLHDPETLPLDAEDIQNLFPIPRSLQFISWGCYSGKQVFRVSHNPVTMRGNVVPIDLPQRTKEVVYDWRNENTLQSDFTL